jgi:hypothetical protein
MLLEFRDRFCHKRFRARLLSLCSGFLGPFPGVKLIFRHLNYGLLAPSIYAMMGIILAHRYGMAISSQLDTGTYVWFLAFCGAASYIAVPAVQRLTIPEARPTLPLAASLGLTFSYNVNIGIPVYVLIPKINTEKFPVR